MTKNLAKAFGHRVQNPEFEGKGSAVLVTGLSERDEKRVVACGCQPSTRSMPWTNLQSVVKKCQFLTAGFEREIILSWYCIHSKQCPKGG